MVFLTQSVPKTFHFLRIGVGRNFFCNRREFFFDFIIKTTRVERMCLIVVAC